MKLKSLEKIANSTELKDLANLSPQIMNHDTLRRENYDPNNILSKLEKKSQEEHKELINAYKKYQEKRNDELIKVLICKLAQLLYVVRSNIALGEKTTKGPDKRKRYRDDIVCKTIYPLLSNIMKEIFNNPNINFIWDNAAWCSKSRFIERH